MIRRRWIQYLSCLCWMALGVCVVAMPAHGFVEVEKDNSSFEAIGAARVTSAYLHSTDDRDLFTDDALSLAVLRLIAEGAAGDSFDYELHLFADMSRQPPGRIDAAFATAGSFDSPYRYPHLIWDYWEEGDVTGRMGIDRLVFNWDLEPFFLSVGRMPINYSVTQIFTVNDFFAPFATTAVNTIYKPGVDTIKLGFAPGPLSTVEAAFVMGFADDAAPSWTQSALVLYAQTVQWNIEWALIGGKLAERYVAAASVQGELGPFGLRTEGQLGFPDRDGDGALDDFDGDGNRAEHLYFRVAAGLDTSFVWKNAAVGAEYMFLSDGADDPGGYLDRYLVGLYPDDLLFAGRHYVGLMAGLDLIPILRLQAFSLINAGDGSGLGYLFLVYSISDEAEAVFGAYAPWGRRFKLQEVAGDPVPELRSEFGDAPFTVFLETRFYF